MSQTSAQTKLIRYNDSIYAVDQDMVRGYLIVGTKCAMMLDTGTFPCALMDLIRSVTDLPVFLVNTHADGDHTANNGFFSQVHLHPDDVSVLYRFRPDYAGSVLPMAQGDCFDLGDRVLEVIAAPGHTPGSICLLDRANRILFAADTVQRGSVFLFGDHRCPEKFPDTLKKLQAMSSDFDIVFPCHGPWPLGPDTIPDLLACYYAAVAGELPAQIPDRAFRDNAKPLLYALNGCSVLLPGEEG